MTLTERLTLNKAKLLISNGDILGACKIASNLPLHSTPESAKFQQENETRQYVGNLQNLIANGLLSADNAQIFINSL